MTYLEKLRSDPRVKEVSDERTDEERRDSSLQGDGIWVYLSPGWTYPDDPQNQPCTCVHEWNIKDLRREMARVVKWVTK